MARGINRVTLVGYVGADPELMHSEQGTPICNISLATTEGWRDMNGQVQTRTEWHRVVFFKRTAEVAAEFLRKGSLVYVEGRLSTNRWEDQQGIVRYTTEIIGTELQMLSSRPQDQGQRGQGSDDNASQNGYSGYGSNYSGGYGNDLAYVRSPDGSYSPIRGGNNQASWNPNLKKKQFNQKGKHGPSDYAAGVRSGQYGGKASSPMGAGKDWKQEHGKGQGQKPAASAAESTVKEPPLDYRGIDDSEPF